MSILGSSWRAEGFYEDDGYGDYSFVDDPDRIRELHQEGKLLEHDGMSMGEVNKHDPIEIKKGKYK